MAHFLLYNLGQDNHNNNSNPMTDHRFSSSNKPFLYSPPSMSRQGEPLETSHRDSQDHKQWTMSVPHPKIIPSEPLFPGESPPLLDAQSLEVKPTINYDRKQVLVHDESSTTVSSVPANKSHTFQFIPYHAGSESNHHMVSQNKGIMKKKKKRKTKKNKIIIPMRDMIRLFSMPQQVAARKLNVSISTLKRRFYELDLPKWPANHTLQEFCLGEMNSEAVKCTYHSSSSSNNNNSSNTRSNSPVNSGMSTTNHNTLSSSDNSLHLKQNASYYSLYREPTDEEKKSLGTVLNMYDTMDEKYIDPMTMTILKEAFLENTEAANNRDGCGNSTSSDSEEEAAPKK